jgi:hypothetical protein
MQKTLILIALALILGHSSAYATDDKTPPAPGEVKPNAPGATQATGQETADAETTNRMKTLEGSKSPFSGQLNLSYQGSSISHPFSPYAPNTTGQNPPPEVTASGTAAARYRYDKVTTMGVGTGVSMYPFGAKHATASDPYADVARSYSFDGIHNRADFQFTYWTNDQYHNGLGYREGLSLSNESTYVLKFGLTLGFLIEIDYNFFSGDAAYATKTAGNDITAGQVQWDLITDPFFEYAINDRFNLRTVIGIQSQNTRDLANDFALGHPPVYETLGVGIQILPAWFIYPFVQFFYDNMEAQNTVVGFNTIINLF